MVIENLFCTTVRPLYDAVSVHLIISKGASIRCTICPFLLPLSMPDITTKIALIPAPIVILKRAPTLLQIVFPLPSIATAITISILSKARGLPLLPLPDIKTPVRGDDASLA